MFRILQWPPDILPAMSLSVCIIALNEEATISRTFESVKAIAGGIIVVDSGSTDSTVALAQAHGAKVFIEPWIGFALQKNSALAKASCDWILSLDADEAVSPVKNLSRFLVSASR
jgi:glycosyltransferase involved in cell wall biosynthesis